MLGCIGGIFYSVTAQTATLLQVEVSVNPADTYSIPRSVLFKGQVDGAGWTYSSNHTSIKMETDTESPYLRIIPSEFSPSGGSTTDAIITAKKTGSSSVNVNVSVTVITPDGGRPEVSREIRRSDVPFLRDSFLRFPLEPQLFLGNGIKITSDILGAKGKPIGLFGYQTSPIDIALLGLTSISERDVKKVYFGSGFAVTIDGTNTIDFFTCFTPSPLDLNCRRLVQASGQITQGAKYTVNSVGKFEDDYYFIALTEENATTSKIIVAKGNQFVGTETKTERLVSCTGFIGFELSKEANPRAIASLACIQSDFSVVIIQHKVSDGTFSQTVSSIDPATCPTTLYALGDNTVAIEHRCADLQAVRAYDIADTSKILFERKFEAADKIVSKMCFYEDSVLIARSNQTHRELFLTNLRPDENRNETFLLDQFGVGSDWTLSCVSGSRVFAVSSADQTGKLINYAMFDAQSSGKAIKRYYSTLPGQSTALTAHGWNGNLLLTSLDDSGAITAFVSFADGQLLYVDANGSPAESTSSGLQTQPQALDKQVPFTMMLTVTDYKKHQIQIPFVASVVYQNPNLTFTPKQELEKASGTLRLSSIGALSGAVTSVQVTQKDNSVIAASDLTVRGALDVVKSLPLGPAYLQNKTKYNYFEYISVSGNLTVLARQTKNTPDRTLQLFFYFGQDLVFSLDQEVQSRVLSVAAITTEDGIGVAYSTRNRFNPKKSELSVLKIVNQKVVSSGVTTTSSPIRKLKFFTTDSAAMLLGLTESNQLTVYLSSRTEVFSIELKSTVANIIDCAPTSNQTSYLLACIRPRALGYTFLAYNMEGNLDKTTEWSYPDAYHDLRPLLLSIAAKDMNNFICYVHNTPTAYIFEVCFNKTNMAFQTYSHFKYKYFEVASVGWAGAHIVASTYTSRFGLKIHELHTWKSGNFLAGSGQLAYSLPLSNTTFTGDQPETYFVPIATKDDQADKTNTSGYVTAAFLDSETPQIHFIKVDETSLEFHSNSLTLDSLNLEFSGMNPSSILLSKVLKPSDASAAKVSGLAWLWWTLVIVTIVLMFLACFMVFVTYKRNDPTVYDKADQDDFSMSKMGETMGGHGSVHRYSVKGSVHDQDENVPA